MNRRCVCGGELVRIYPRVYRCSRCGCYYVYSRVKKWYGPLVNPPVMAKSVQEEKGEYEYCLSCGIPLRYRVEKERGYCLSCQEKIFGIKLFKSDVEREEEEMYRKYIMEHFGLKRRR